MTQTPASNPATPDELRALDADELSLADMTRPPALHDLSDAELSQTITRLRDRRNRARDLADRQAREVHRLIACGRPGRVHAHCPTAATRASWASIQRQPGMAAGATATHEQGGTCN